MMRLEQQIETPPDDAGERGSFNASVGDDVSLSPRQIECLRLVSEGFSTPQIARLLGLSRRTVDEYISSACKRLGACGRSHAVAVAIIGGLLSRGISPTTA